MKLEEVNKILLELENIIKSDIQHIRGSGSIEYYYSTVSNRIISLFIDTIKPKIYGEGELVYLGKIKLLPKKPDWNWWNESNALWYIKLIKKARKSLMRL